MPRTPKRAAPPPPATDAAAGDDDVEILTRADGQVTLLPKAARWLAPELRTTLEECQLLELKLAALNARQDETAVLMREQGVSWGLLASALLMSEMGAKRRILAAARPAATSERRAFLGLPPGTAPVMPTAGTS